MTEPDGVRLQKVMAAAGIASRRASEELIAAGRVEVNGETVRTQGRRVNPATDIIRVDGVRLPQSESQVYLALNKPFGVVSTMHDQQGRVALADFVSDRPERLFHVGRLDAETEGLILLTNDGDLAHRLAHPAFAVSKTYLAEVSGQVAPAALQLLYAGVDLADGPIQVDQVQIIDRGQSRTLLEVQLHSGRNRIVRRMLAKIGHPVLRLSRTAMGPIRLGSQASGTVRALTSAEVGALLDLGDE